VSIRNRLGRLEQSAQNRRDTADEAISHEVLRRTTDDELRAYEGALRRMLDGEEPVQEDEAILARIHELREEVTSVHQTTTRLA
jgi:hypothetical protein